MEIFGSKKGVRHHDFYSELVLRGVGHGYFYFILAGLLPPLVAPHGDSKLSEFVLTQNSLFHQIANLHGANSALPTLLKMTCRMMPHEKR